MVQMPCNNVTKWGVKRRVLRHAASTCCRFMYIIEIYCGHKFLYRLQTLGLKNIILGLQKCGRGVLEGTGGVVRFTVE